MKSFSIYHVAVCLAFMIAGVWTVELYGLSVGPIHLITVDTLTGNVTKIGKPLPYEDGAQGLSSIDTKKGLLYCIGYNASVHSAHSVSLLGLRLSDGVMVTEIKLPFVSSFFVGAGESVDVIPETGEVLVSGHDPAFGKKHHVLKVDPVSGKQESIFVIDMIDVLGQSSSFDPYNGLLWIQLSKSNHSHFLGIDIKDKSLKYDVENHWAGSSSDFDPLNKVILTMGLVPAHTPIGVERALIGIDESGKATVLHKIPGYFIINAGSSAFNTKDRILYTMMTESTKKGAGIEFDLVALQVDTGAVDHIPAFCSTGASDCPWTLAYDNLL